MDPEAQNKETSSSQMGRFKLNEIFAYVRDRVYPEGLTKIEKCSLRRRSKFFSVKDAELYYRGNPKAGKL